MTTIIFESDDAVFQFDHKAVMQCLENRKSSYEINELDNLIKALTNQPENATLSLEEHRYFGFIVLDLIHSGEGGSSLCKICDRTYDSNQLEAFTVRPDATFKDIVSKKRGLKSLFRKRPKLPGYGGKGYKCKNGHILIYMQTWTT